MKRTLWFWMVLALAVALPVFLSAAAPREEASKPVTGDWTFTLKPMDAQGNPAQEGISIPMSLQESASLVYATCCGGERLLGHREGKKLHLQFLSHGVTDTDVKAGGVQTAGGMELKVKENGTLEGEAVTVATGEGPDVFSRFAVTARRGQAGVGWSPRNICEDLDLGALLADILEDLSDDVFSPMDVCNATKDGGGFYVFGHIGPGDPSRPFGTTTVYLPLEFSLCPVPNHSSREYAFTLSSGGAIADIQELEAAIQGAARFLALFHVNTETFIQHVDAVFSDIPQLAISIGVSTHTYYVTLYINLGENVSDSVCARIQNSALVQDIKAVFDKGFGFNIMCGHNISDSYDLRRQIVPSYDWGPISCTTPVVFMYVLGTINVDYN